MRHKLILTQTDRDTLIRLVDNKPLPDNQSLHMEENFNFFRDQLLAAMPHLNVINVVVDKSTQMAGYDPFVLTWKVLIQRFSNTISHRNFPGPMNPDERGMIFPDQTDVKELTQLVRQMRRYNPIPQQPSFGLGYRNMAVTNIVEDPSVRDSSHSYFIQGADLTAFLLYQKLAPNSYIKRKSAHNYFDRLEPILCKVASSKDG